MTYDELLRVIAASKDEDWLYLSPPGVRRVYKGDLNVRFELPPEPEEEILAESDRIRRMEERIMSQDWAVNACGEAAARPYFADFGLYYGSSLVEEVAMAEISIEGVYIPFPIHAEGGVLEIPEWKYRLGKVASMAEAGGDRGVFDRCLGQAGISVASKSSY